MTIPESRVYQWPLLFGAAKYKILSFPKLRRERCLDVVKCVKIGLFFHQYSDKTQ